MLNTVLIIICVLMLLAMLGLDIFISKDLKNTDKSNAVNADDNKNNR